MALTLIDLQAKRDALMSAISSGVLRINFQDRHIQYQTTGDMINALAQVDNEIKTAAGTPRTRFAVAQFTK